MSRFQPETPAKKDIRVFNECEALERGSKEKQGCKTDSKDHRPVPYSDAVEPV
jgi:hypothetical protein